jgi:hypothetical protein
MTCPECGRPEETYDFSGAAMTIHDALVSAINDLEKKNQETTTCKMHIGAVRWLAQSEGGTTLLDLPYVVQIIPMRADRHEYTVAELWGASKLLAKVHLPISPKRKASKD